MPGCVATGATIEEIEQPIKEASAFHLDGLREQGSLPVVTIGNADRVLDERNYRNQCVDLLLEIVIDIENYMGVGRLFIP